MLLLLVRKNTDHPAGPTTGGGNFLGAGGWEWEP
jgi:hypothetical protein